MPIIFFFSHARITICQGNRSLVAAFSNFFAFSLKGTSVCGLYIQLASLVENGIEGDFNKIGIFRLQLSGTSY